ncbi:NAD(P)-binding domain-containing protein [Nonomuraea sp. NPDC049486]|uniref:NADPH-dependent F420 reductase n=1 Tax=Nonomuraea sp. NPDC049486 TaxID=3155773 RepID=UPI00342BB063
MKIGVLGTGDVGRRLASKLSGLGHEVTLGSRTADNPVAAAWAREHQGHHDTFAGAATHGELVVNATGGLVALAALKAAGTANLDGKIVVDVSNPLDFSQGFPPRLVVPAAGSVAEQLQQAFPSTRIVKTLNTMHNTLMTDPAQVPGPHNVFVCGDDQAARAQVADLLKSFGWADRQILDLGGLAAARCVEPLVLLWISLSGTLRTSDFNFAILR